MPPIDRSMSASLPPDMPAPRPLPWDRVVLSVVIPCYNERENIRECIGRTPVMGGGTEILVVDDGSSDGTADLAREVAATDDRVTRRRNAVERELHPWPHCHASS